jgi:hypothetical protein
LPVLSQIAASNASPFATGDSRFSRAAAPNSTPAFDPRYDQRAGSIQNELSKLFA